MECSHLDRADAEELEALVATVERQPCPTPELSGMPDVFIYRLSVIDENGRWGMAFDDLTATPDLHALVTRVRELADESQPDGWPPGL